MWYYYGMNVVPILHRKQSNAKKHLLCCAYIMTKMPNHSQIQYRFHSKNCQLCIVFLYVKSSNIQGQENIKNRSISSRNPTTRLCIMEYRAEYIDRTEPLRGNHKNLLINYVKPHQPVSKATVARWIKEVLRVSGIDTKKFTAHSCRTVSTSPNKVAGVNLCEILKSARWSNTQTFADFYDKPISN